MLRAAESICRTDTGRQRRENEDSAMAQAPVFVVADGMGGARAGEVASQLAVETFEQGLGGSGSGEELLAERVREANRAIYDKAAREPELQGMGTTLTAAYLDDSHLSIAHVGDSRAYLFRDGELKRLTQDHSLVDELVRRGKLTEEQAAEHPQRSIITRALGIEPDVEVDTWSYPVRAGDVLLLCSDGLTSMVPESRMAEILGSAPTLERAAGKLIADANDAGGRDNITVVLFRLEDVGEPDAEQATVVGQPPPAADAPTTPDATAVLTPESPAPPRPVAMRRSPTPPIPDTASEAGRGRRVGKPLAALIAVLVVLFLVGGGGYLATRQLYFVGTNSQGIVTIYRGLPYQLPAGISLYETYFVSGVPATLVPPDRRGSIFNNQLRSQNSALDLVRQIELGRVSQ
jgi:serine/threonine protein phosphatase PrpC